MNRPVRPPFSASRWWPQPLQEPPTWPPAAYGPASDLHISPGHVGVSLPVNKVIAIRHAMKLPHKLCCRLQFRCLALCLCLTAAWWAPAARNAASADEPSPDQSIHADVALLAADDMQGRAPGTAGLDRAAEFIAKRFEELGLKTDLVDGRPFQPFKSSTRVPRVRTGADGDATDAVEEKQPETDPSAGPPSQNRPSAPAPGESGTGSSGAGTGSTSPSPYPATDHLPEQQPVLRSNRSQRRPVEVRNVVALLPGEGPRADEIIVVGAHYDHLGYREKSGKITVFNGANDNASGTAAMLEIARILSQRGQRLPRSVLLIAFAAEERGLLGSFYYVKHPVLPMENTVAMINLDMVGCLEDDRITASGVGTSPALGDLVEQVAAQHDLDVTRMPGSIGGSDHMAFYTHEIPVVHLITTGGWNNYHKPTDDVETIDCQGIARISRMAAEVVVLLAQSDERPEFKDSGWGGTIARNLFRFMGSAASAMVEPKKNDQQN